MIERSEDLKMREAAILFEPIVEVRDVLESYLHDRVLLANWRSTLSNASARLVELGTCWSDDELSELGMRLQLLTARNSWADEELALEVARKVEAILDELRIPGIPRPGDADWTF